MFCPRCQYDLTGLPEEHACPECGLRYDSQTTGVVCRGRRKLYYAATLGVANALVLMLWGARVSLGLPVLAAVGTVLVGAWVLRLYGSRRWASRIILNPEGVRFEPPSLPANIFPWANVSRAEYSWVDGRLRIFDPTGNELAAWSYQLLGSVRTAKWCAREINRLAAIYRALPPPDDTQLTVRAAPR